MVNEKAYQMGAVRSCIRELYEYGRVQAAQVGEENVFDFSGVNEFTNEMTNYYETSHYRPKVCKELLRIIYDGNKDMQEVK